MAEYLRQEKKNKNQTKLEDRTIGISGQKPQQSVHGASLKTGIRIRNKSDGVSKEFPIPPLLTMLGIYRCRAVMSIAAIA
jgi:hypothetical protein